MIQALPDTGLRAYVFLSLPERQLELNAGLVMVIGKSRKQRRAFVFLPKMPYYPREQSHSRRGSLHEWLALLTKPGAEFHAQASLRSRDLETFLPTVPKRLPTRGSNKQPLFPRYIFVHIDLSETPAEVLRWTPGLVRPFMIGGSYARVPQEAIDLIRERLREAESRGRMPFYQFQPGQEVRILSGPLQGLYGVFEGSRKPSERVTILVEFLRRTNRVQLPVDHLEATRKPPSQHPSRRTRGRGRRIRQEVPSRDSGRDTES